MPRPNGYQSLHTSVISEHGFPFEVQIRTEEMHRRAEEGIAAHWKYKEGRVGDNRDERYFQWMRQLLEVQQEVRDPQEFLRNLKIDLYPEEVYIFTPKGEVRSLPRGATAVDFAYSVHTDVGNQCVGARINGKMVPLRTPLQNGDIVAIVTQAGTGRAGTGSPSSRRRGRAARSGTCCRARNVRAASSSDAGCSKRRRGASASTPRPCSRVRSSRKFASEYGAQKIDELLAHIGYGKLSARTVLQKAVPGGLPKEKLPDSAVRVGRQARAAVGGLRRQDQGPRDRRRDGVSRQVLQSDPRRADRRLHHAREGRLGALGRLPERPQPDVRSRAADRRRVGQHRSRSGALRRASDDAGRGSQGHARRDQREGIRTSTPTSPTWRPAPATITRPVST